MEKTYTILCVDDEEGILDSLQRSLRLDGYNVLTALSGAQGLEILEKEKVDLIISDQRMPNMSGYEFLKLVREKHPHIGRIILSGYTDFESLVQSINQGEVFRFLYKPWDLAELRKTIHATLEQNAILSQVSGLLRSLKATRGVWESAVVDQEFNSIMLKVTPKKQMESMEEVLEFLDSIIESLGLKKNEGAEIIANAISKNKNNLVFNIDLGKNVMLKVEIPVLTQKQVET